MHKEKGVQYIGKGVVVGIGRDYDTIGRHDFLSQFGNRIFNMLNWHYSFNNRSEHLCAACDTKMCSMYIALGQ